MHVVLCLCLCRMLHSVHFFVSLSSWLEKQNWCELCRADSVINKMTLFSKRLLLSLPSLLQSNIAVQTYTRDKPWMTSLIVERQRDWKNSNSTHIALASQLHFLANKNAVPAPVASIHLSRLHSP